MHLGIHSLSRRAICSVSECCFADYVQCCRINYVTYMYDELRIFRLTDFNKYLIGRFMFRFSNKQVPALFYSFVAYNHEVHSYDTWSVQHFHIPQIKTNLGKTGIKYRGDLLWNKILSKGMYPDTSECVFVKFIKTIVNCHGNMHTFRLSFITFKIFLQIVCKVWVINSCVKSAHSMHSTCLCYLVGETDYTFLPPLLYQC